MEEHIQVISKSSLQQSGAIQEQGSVFVFIGQNEK